jgi:VWFA-related protein
MLQFLSRGMSGIAAGVALLGSLSGIAQHPTSPAGGANPQGYTPSTITVNARIVVLDVVVTDKQGRVVHRDLTRDDFKVLEDGVTQTIRTFEPPSDHRMPASDGAAVVKSAADLKKIGNAPVAILVLDELNSTFQDSSFSRQMLVKYLKSQPAVLKEPTVLMVATNVTFQQLHDYTQDRDALIEAVKKHMPEYPWRMMNSGKSGPGAVERMAQVLGALQQIAQSSMGTPGRKNLIWVGNGFPSSDLVSLPRDEADVIETALRRCTDRLLAARVTVYTINPTADSASTVEVDTQDALNTSLDENHADPFGGSVSFADLAPTTGGIAFAGRNDLNNVIGESIDEGQVYYTLSYSPSNRSQDAAKFRKIKIVMTDLDLRATTRDGYYPETDADLNPVLDKTMTAKMVRANLELDLSAALTTTISYNGLDVTAAKTGSGKYTIHVAEKGIAWSEPTSDGPSGNGTAANGAAANGEQHEEATVAAGWYDAKGKLLGHVAREEISPRAAGNAGAVFQLPVTLPGNVVRLRFVVRDALNGSIGTVDVTTF